MGSKEVSLSEILEIGLSWPQWQEMGVGNSGATG